MTTQTPPRGKLLGRRFWWHYAEMLVAMVAGMLLLGPVWDVLTGGAELFARPDAAVLVMATNMTLGMAVWMRHRGHGRGAIVEMGAAMYAPFAVLLGPYWAGALSADGLMMAGHVLMLPAMLLVMLRRRAEYAAPHRPSAPLPGGPVARALAARWPTWLALLMTITLWTEPMVPPPPLLLVLPVAYLVIGVLRRTLRGPGVLALQLAGLAGYAALALAAANSDPAAARYLIAAGWLVHAAWDLGHHVTRKVVPRGYAEWCGVFDLIVGVTILLPNLR
ncbi:hypothetical protein [Streptosporangium sp. NPDC000396]|uniref:hypothetical protein n=1 Tax=Streptosporangium sp. NPDC000396 TaxID=3366185 RepID=UPI0036851BBA